MRRGGCPQSRPLCLLETSKAAQEGASKASEEADAESVGGEGQGPGQHMLRVTDARQAERTGPQRWGASAAAHGWGNSPAGPRVPSGETVRSQSTPCPPLLPSKQPGGLRLAREDCVQDGPRQTQPGQAESCPALSSD